MAAQRRGKGDAQYICRNPTEPTDQRYTAVPKDRWDNVLLQRRYRQHDEREDRPWIDICLYPDIRSAVILSG